MMQSQQQRRPRGGVDTKRGDAAAAMMLEKSAESPLKGRRALRFTHFSQRNSVKLADADVFHMRFNSDAGLSAVSFFDGSLQIISTMLGD